MKEWQVPGLALAVVEGDRVVFSSGFGFRTAGKREKVDENTVFAIGSASKAFTAFALAFLKHEQRLNWQDSVTQHLEGFQLHDAYATRQITIADLLTHQSGLPRGDRLWYGSGFRREEILKRIRYLQPEWTFRARFGYQNVMYLAAGQIIPRVTGKSWDLFLRDRIFKPLGMNDTSTSILDHEGNQNLASPHGWIDNQVKPIPWRNIDNVGPAGSINSNLSDMTRWLTMWLGEGQWNGVQLLPPESIRELVTPRVVVPQTGRYAVFFPETRFLNYGFGWFLHDYHGSKIITHGGSIDGMRASVTLVPEKNLGIVVLSNLAGNLLPTALKLRIIDSYFGLPMRDWSRDLLDRYREGVALRDRVRAQRDKDRQTATSASLAVADFSGTYASELLGEATISLENGTLQLKISSEFSGSLTHWHYDTFLVTWDDAYLGEHLITFSKRADGGVRGFTLEGAGEYDRK